LKKRARLRKRINEIEEIRDVFEKTPAGLYDGMFDTKPRLGNFDIRGFNAGSSRVSALLASDAELTDYEPMSNKNSSFVVLKLEQQIQTLNAQLKVLQDNLSFTEKGLEKVHLANRHSLVSLVKMFRSPADHNLTYHLELDPSKTLCQFAGLVATLLKLTRTNYAVDEPAVKPKYATCVMKRDDALHTLVQIRNDKFVEESGSCNDVICLMAGMCLKVGASRGLVFMTEKRELYDNDAKADTQLFKSKGLDIILIFVEDLLDELPSEPKAVEDFLGSLADNITLFTG
jgi:hypothetical protein